MQKCVKIPHNPATFGQTNDFPGGSKISQASERPQNGGKMTGMDIPEIKDINRPALMPKNGAIGQILPGGVNPPQYL